VIVRLRKKPPQAWQFLLKSDYTPDMVRNLPRPGSFSSSLTTPPTWLNAQT